MDRRRSLLKIAALRTEREHQQGVDCSQGYLQSSAAGLLAEGPRTLECLFKYAPSDKMQMISGFGSSMMEVDVMSSANQIRFYCGGTFATAAIVLGNNYLAHISYDGTTAICYLNGTEAARFTVTGYKVADLFSTGSPSYAPKGSLVFCRHYNYALSAEEIAALYNNGDPAGYVLPAAMKGLTPVEIVGDNSYTWTGVDDPTYSYAVRYSRPFTIGKVYKIRLLVSDWESGNAPFIKIGSTGSYYLPDFNGNGTYEIYAIPNGTPYAAVYVYAGQLGTDRRMTITVDSVEPVGCIAEYLPQNLVGQRYETPVEIVGENSYTWTGVDDSTYGKLVNLSKPLNVGSSYRIAVTVSGYEAGSPSINMSGVDSKAIPGANGTYLLELKKTVDYPARVVIYGGPANSDRRLTLTVDSIEPIPDIALSWLDSAKQLPLNDEYQPPLLQSDGGYDLTASGMPEIIIK